MVVKFNKFLNLFKVQSKSKKRKAFNAFNMNLSRAKSKFKTFSIQLSYWRIQDYWNLKFGLNLANRELDRVN